MAKTYYVSVKNGNDKNPGSDKKPFKTIQMGINKLSAGDTLLVREGTYTEQVVINRSGDNRNLITIKAHPNEKPVIDGSNIQFRKGARLVSIIRCQYVVFAGFDVRNSFGRGIGVQDCKHVTVDNCSVKGCQANGIYVADSEDTLVQNCRVQQCAQDYVTSAHVYLTAAIYLKRSTKIVLRGTRCFENPGDGIAAFFVRECTVRENTCYDNRSSQILLSSVRDTTVDSNFLYHTGRQKFLHLSGGRPPGIVKRDRKTYVTTGYWHTNNLTIANNIIVGCGRGFQGPRIGGALTQVSIIHNTFVNNSESALAIDALHAHNATVVENNLVSTTNGGTMSAVRNPGGVIWRHNFWSQNPDDAAFNPVNDVVSPNTGLRDINAPVVAGQATTAPYELTAVSPAVNMGVSSAVAIDFYGRTRDLKPDIGAHELDNTGGPGGDDPELPPSNERVKTGLQVLYDFSAGWGNTVTDVSGQGAPLNLTIQNTAAVQWANQGLIIKSPTTIQSGGPATKVIEACKSTDEITIEAWITPATVEQGGPSRIVSISQNPNQRNVTLAQGLKPGEPTSLYNVRLRTTNSDENGIPSLSTATDSLLPQLTHVAFTRDKEGRAIIYINGQERAVDRLRGALNNWATNQPLLLANEKTGDRPWLGTYKLVAIFNRALTSREVQHNYNAGLPEVEPIVADFKIGAWQEIGMVPHTVNFDSSDSYAANGIKTYAWTFGDGATSTEANPAHTYDKTGIYTVALTITDNNGLTSTATKTDLIAVTDNVLPTLPNDYARFIIANIVESRVLAFGVQYPDFRCVLEWNEEPHHVLIYRSIEDVIERHHVPGTISLVWVDYPDAEEEDEPEEA